MLNYARERKASGSGVGVRARREVIDEAQIHADMLRARNHQVIEEARTVREEAERVREEALTEKEMNSVKEGRIVCKNADGTLKIAYDDGTEGFMIREQITHVAKRVNARAEVSQCIGCLENQPNQLAHTEPGGCLYDESDEEDVWGELGPPPPPPVLKRQVAWCVSEDEVIVLNGEYIVCA